jgi:hypothetical protein
MVKVQAKRAGRNCREPERQGGIVSVSRTLRTMRKRRYPSCGETSG